MFEKFFKSPADQQRAGFIPEAQSSCYVFTIKKSGTHLLRFLLEELGMNCIDCLDYEPVPSTEVVPGDESAFVLSHRMPSRRFRGSCHARWAKIIMNVRDPRAVFLSLLDFFDWNRPLSANRWYPVMFRRDSCRAAFKDRDTLAMALLEDELIDDDPFTPWLTFRRSRTLFHSPDVLKVRYEDFFSKEGGSAGSEENVVVRICRYLGRPVPSDSGQLVLRAVGAPTLTRNAAKPDRWRTELPPHLLAAFMGKHGDLVREFGYPET